MGRGDKIRPATGSGIYSNELERNNTMSQIAIVGAGIAGLNAALTLQDSGLTCHIYEASKHIGGRMHSDATTWGEGMVSELCGEFIDSDNDTLHSLIERFGLKIVNVNREQGERQNNTYLANHYRSVEEMAEAFELVSPIIEQQATDTGFPTTYTSYTQTGYELDHMSVYEWIERYVPNGHQSLAGRLLETGCTGFYGLPTKEQSALNLVYMFASRSTQNTPTPARPLQGAVKIAGGNQRLPLMIADSLPQEKIHLQHQLVAMRRNADETITLSFTTQQGPVDVICDHAILSLPFSTLRHVDYSQAGFDALKQTAITQLGYGTISKLFLLFDTHYWHNNFLVTDLDIQTIWDGTEGETGTKGMLVDYMGGSFGAAYTSSTPYITTRDSEQVQRYAHHCLKQLEQIFPGISPHYSEVAALSSPTSDPYLRGSYSCWGVGQYTLFAGYERLRQGNIHFAGEHCSLEKQGYMEGAAREGTRAAREVLEDLAYNHTPDSIGITP
jgi:monoamine oxidase